MQGTGAEKGIPGEEERDFLYNSLPGTGYHEQKKYIHDGMKSKARAL